MVDCFFDSCIRTNYWKTNVTDRMSKFLQKSRVFRRYCIQVELTSHNNRLSYARNGVFDFPKKRTKIVIKGDSYPGMLNAACRAVCHWVIKSL